MKTPSGSRMVSGDSVRFKTLLGSEQVMNVAAGGIPSGTPGATYVLEGSFEGGEFASWIQLAPEEVVGPNGKLQSVPSFPFLRTVRVADETQAFTLRNVGTTALTNIQFILEGENADAFSVNSPFGLIGSLPAGGSATFEITVVPGDVARPKALLSIQSNDADENPFFILLNGQRSYRLRALEVTQGVQDWANSVPLVTGRKTFVRAFLEKITTALSPTVKLLGFDANEVPLGDLSPLKLSENPTAYRKRRTSTSERPTIIALPLSCRLHG